jgi:Ca2+:H+ antiporter
MTSQLELGGLGEPEDGDEPKVVVEKDLDVLAQGWTVYWTRSIKALFFESWFNICMLAAPFAAYYYYTDVDGNNAAMTFGCSLVAIAPFAERLSFVTEQLAMHTSETLGGLLNATFGNVTELVVSLIALNRGLLRIVQVSLLGSILSNMLLVLGCAFLFGGVKHKTQRFNRTASSMNSGLLLLSVMSLTFPMLLNATHQATHDTLDPVAVLYISRVVAAMLLVVYCLYLFFQLYTHQHLYEDEAEADDDDEEAVLGVWGAILWLAVITVFIAFLSEYMVDAIEGAAHEVGVPDLFLGTIIIPIVGNAAEHAAAIIFAYKNKMELALGIAIGSSTQIALFVIPLCIVIAWFVDRPLSLDFHPFESGVLLLTVLLVGFLVQNGESNWLQGVMLVTAYLVVSAGFFVHVDPVVPPAA